MVEGALRGRPVTEPALERRPRPRGRLRAFRRDERGTALVEFALVAPILFLLLFGILDFARALNYYNNLTQLAGQGARAAAVNCNPDGTCPVSGTSIQTQLAGNYAQGALHNKMSACITGASGIGQPVTVTTSYQFKFLPLIGVVVGSPNITLTASQTERQEIAPTYSTGCAS